MMAIKWYGPALERFTNGISIPGAYRDPVVIDGVAHTIHILWERNANRFYVTRETNGAIEAAYGPLDMPIGGDAKQFVINPDDWSPSLASTIAENLGNYDEVYLA